MASGGSYVTWEDSTSTEPNPNSRKGLKRYECPVCLDLMISQIYQCHNGHTFCHACEPRLSNCPICRESLPARKIRTLALEDIILEMEFDCKSKDKGCNASLKSVEMEEHGYQCPFTKHFFCKFFKFDCNHESNFEEIIGHLKTAHGVTGIDLSNISLNGRKEKDWVEVQQQLLRTEFETLGTKVGFAPHYFLFEGERFLLSSKLDLTTKSLAWKVTVLGGKSVSERFSVKMKLVSNCSVLKWEGTVADLKIPNSPQCIFNVRLSTLETFLKRLPGSYGWSLYVRILRDEVGSKRKGGTVESAVLETVTFRAAPAPAASVPKRAGGGAIAGASAATVRVQYHPFPLPDGFCSTVFGAGHGSRFHIPWNEVYTQRQNGIGFGAVPLGTYLQQNPTRFQRNGP